MSSTDSYPRQNARTRRFSLGVPRNFAIADDGSRVRFLRSSAGDDPVNRLWEIDVASGAETVLVDPATLGLDDADLPAAERARRERLREAGGGIVAFDSTTDLAISVFALAGQLFRHADGGTEALPSEGAAFDPRLSPDGSLVGYVSGPALRLTGAEDRLLIAEDDPHVSWGSAEFVAAEEMGRLRGFWWAPDSRRLAATRVDVSTVSTWWISAPVTPAREPRAVRYPAAGTENAMVDLAILDLDGGRIDVDWRHGEFEYLADVQWTTDGLILVAQPRDQRTCAVLEVDPETGATSERYRWTDDAWVEIVPGAPRIVGERLVTVEDRGAARSLVVDGETLTPPDVQVKRVVTVTDAGVALVATTDPTEAHLVFCSWTGDLEWHTEASGMWNVVVNGGTRVVTHASLDHVGTTVTVGRGEVVTAVANVAETPTISPNVTMLTLGERGLRGALVMPHDTRPGTKLPVLLDPYGGPHAQRVLAAQSMYLASQWFADAGFAVLVVDGRGTPTRGPAFEREVYGDLAQPVLDDQVDGLLAAAALDDRLDLDRVAIRGWSFGGYLAALAVLRRPDVFHAAIAGAPVTDWRLYDTHYTERYLGHPDTVPAHYERTDLCAEAAALTRPLQLIHGLADDNVVAAHTLQFSRALLEAGRPHEVLPLSDVTHMTPQEEVAENLLLLQLDFLHRSLPSVAILDS